MQNFVYDMKSICNNRYKTNTIRLDLFVNFLLKQKPKEVFKIPMYIEAA